MDSSLELSSLPSPAFVAKCIINVGEGAARRTGHTITEVSPIWLAEAIHLYYTGVVNATGFGRLIEVYFEDLGV